MQRRSYRRLTSFHPSHLFTSVVQASKSSVVSIITEEKTNPFSLESSIWKQLFAELTPQEEKKTNQFGAGFIVHRNGYILTNEHVIQDASLIQVHLQGYQKSFPAKVIWSNHKRDLAILKIQTPSSLKPLPLGSSKHSRVGEWVIAAGNPFGLGLSYTAGIISGKNRLIRSGRRTYRHVIQTDAAINPGNSGGPLINLAGEVIGMNTMIIYPSQSIGFAIPIEEIKPILQYIR